MRHLPAAIGCVQRRHGPSTTARTWNLSGRYSRVFVEDRSRRATAFAGPAAVRGIPLWVDCGSL